MEPLLRPGLGYTTPNAGGTVVGSEQCRLGATSFACFADAGAPPLNEPHFDEFGAGADVGGPPGEELDVAVVAASGEAGA
ncbi:hypothetical protein RW1_007_02320 [Rhodococcus wratislaviensis NBRC 100605]|uniref:Uncharacterized protein n=1 Tax=Rhodococcus wratislaviensis NBRC 100605 TaxID=1219028 RepID=X0PYR6_RHOWR|nr:hypothetical protein RW1_007_02320 [Rhodococcus wratislaviensis NBRC 100605]